MGVDGIDKADIFDEYFDDDKPKKTNYEKIKSMSVDEMAELLSEKLVKLHIKKDVIWDKNNPEYCIKQWLLAESEG